MRYLVIVAFLAAAPSQSDVAVKPDQAPAVENSAENPVENSIESEHALPANFTPSRPSRGTNRERAIGAWLDKVDAALDSNVSGMLASLALASAAFLVSLLPSLEREKTESTKQHQAAAGAAHANQQDSAAAEKALAARRTKERAANRLTTAKSAITVLVYAFGAFLVGLMSNLTVDPAADRMIDVLKFHFLPIIDLSTSSGSMLTGVVCLAYGAIQIRRLTVQTGDDA